MQFGVIQVVTEYFGGIPTTKTLYKQRIRVSSDEEELTEYLSFCREIKPENRVEWGYDHVKGRDYYYVIKGWTEEVV